MTGPVTSRYDNIYWIRLFAMLITAIGAIYFTILLIVHWRNINSNLLGEGIALWAGFGVIYMLYFHKSPPRKIVIDNENISIYEYFTHKQTIIKYTDIDTIRVFNQSSDTRRYGSVSFRILQIERYSGEIYRISENDFVNYDFLENAIHQHLPSRH